MDSTPEAVEAAKIVSIYSGMKDRQEARNKIAAFLTAYSAEKEKTIAELRQRAVELTRENEALIKNGIEARALLLRLKAAVILGDAGMSAARSGIIKENEVLLPYLEMKSRAESAESSLANLQGMFDNVVKERDEARSKAVELAQEKQSEIFGLRAEITARTKDRDSWREVAEQHARDNAALRAPVEDAEVEEALKCCEWDSFCPVAQGTQDCECDKVLARFARQSRARVAELEGAIDGAPCECSSVAPVECASCHLREQVKQEKPS